MKRKWGYRNPTSFVFGQAAWARGEGEQPPRADTQTPEPSRHPDTPSRPDTPTPRHPKEGAANANRCKGMQGGARGCKGMQGDASDKARREGVGARGEQRGWGKKPKGAKSKALALMLGGLVLLRAVER